MELTELRSVFNKEFNKERLKNLISGCRGKKVKVNRVEHESREVKSFICLKCGSTRILVLTIRGNLVWTFKLRKLVANYLKANECEDCRVVLRTTEEKNWLWTIVTCEELSSYLLNCYSIPVGASLSKSGLKKVKASLESDNLAELTTDFKASLKTEFIDLAQNYYKQLQEDLNLKSEVKLAKELIIKLIIFYLLTKQELIKVKFETESVQLEDIKQLGQESILAILARQEEIILPAKEVLTQFWTELKSYNFILAEDRPWAKTLALTPAVLADLNEKLLPPKQRRKRGVYYTPAQIVHYMSQETIIDFLTTELEELSSAKAQDLVYERNLTQLPTRLLPKIYHHLTELKVCEPAVGSGAFALGMAKEIFRLAEIIIALLGDDLFREELKKGVVKKALYCLDIDRQAVKITRLRLWLWTESEEISLLTDLGLKVIVANPLLKIERNLAQRDRELRLAQKDYEQASDLTEQLNQLRKFKRIKENKLGSIFSAADYFPTVYTEGGFDILIANPPYLGEKGNKDIFRQVKKYALGRFYQGKMDLFYFFFHLGLEIVKEQGVIALLTTNYFLTATGAYQLRKDLNERSLIKKLVNFNNLRLFPAALGQHNLITILEKEETKVKREAKTVITYREGDADKETLASILSGEDAKSNYYSIAQQDLYQGEEKYLRLERGKVDELLEIVAQKGAKLGSLAEVNQGLVSGCDRISQRHINNYDLPEAVKGAGVFVLTAEEVKNLNLTSIREEILKPWYKNSDIKQYWSQEEKEDEYLLYLTTDMITNLPTVLEEHLRPFQEILKTRREVAAGRRKWWELQWPREKKIFASPKIVVPQRSTKNTFAYNEMPWYASADVYYITQPAPEIDLQYILALLNSRLYYLWFYYKGKKKGDLLELYQKPLTEVPVKIISQAQQQIFIELGEEVQSKKDSLVEYQEYSFWELQRQEGVTTASKLKNIIDGAKEFKIFYQGRAKIVREIKVRERKEKLIVYSAKSDQGDYKLFEFRIAKRSLRKYLKFYLTNLTSQQLTKLNQKTNLALVERILELEIKGAEDEIQAIVDRWEKIQKLKDDLRKEVEDLREKIDRLVYQLYNFTPYQIEFLTKKVNELKNS